MARIFVAQTFDQSPLSLFMTIDREIELNDYTNRKQPTIVKWPDFCSPFIVRRLVPLGLHDTRFRSVPVSYGLRRHTSSVLYVSSAYSAMALSYESPTVPVEGSMPCSLTRVVYTVLMCVLSN